MAKEKEEPIESVENPIEVAQAPVEPKAEVSDMPIFGEEPKTKKIKGAIPVEKILEVRFYETDKFGNVTNYRLEPQRVRGEYLLFPTKE